MLEVELDDELPQAWIESARARVGRDLTARLRRDAEPDIDADRRARADAEAHAVVDRARALVA
jgi:hypothetical protein